MTRFHPPFPFHHPSIHPHIYHSKHTTQIQPTERQLAAERKQRTEGAVALDAMEAAVLATKWREARAALPGTTRFVCVFVSEKGGEGGSGAYLNSVLCFALLCLFDTRLLKCCA